MSTERKPTQDGADLTEGTLPGHGQGPADSAQVGSGAAPETAVALEKTLAISEETLITPLVGSRIGDYELLEEIGRGGMGVVYRARQVSLNRVVALKMILTGGFAGEDEIRRFRTEAQAGATLQHPHIVAIHEVGEQNGQHYFSMAFVEGESLSRQLGHYHQDLRKAARLFVAIAHAVHHAHQRHVLHRDLKPGNVLIDKNGDPHVADFGLAMRIDADPDLSLSGKCVGTPDYMSPEQVMGESDKLTTATDIFSLGATLYHVLTRQAPFHASKAQETLRNVLVEQPQPLHLLNQEVDEDLEAICLKCLEKNPQRRYASADGLAEDLERWLRCEPILARPSNTCGHLVKWARRKPAIAALAVTLICVVLAALAAVTLQLRRVREEQSRTLEANTRLRLQRVEDHFANDNAHEALAALAQLLRLQPTNRVATERLVNALNQRVFLLPSERLPFPASDSAETSPLGRFKVEGRDSVFIRVLEVVSGKTVFVISNAHEKVIRDLHFAPDEGSLVSAGADSCARVWELPTGRLKFTLKHADAVHHAEFSPDGKRVVTASQDRTARLWNSADGGPVGANMIHMNSLNSARFSSDGALVLTASDDGTIRLWHGSSGASASDPLPLALVNDPSPVPVAVEDAWFAADRRSVVARLEDGQDLVFELSSGLTHIPAEAERMQPPAPRTAESAAQARLRALLTPKHRKQITMIDLSLDGQSAATASYDRTARVWNTRTGEPVTGPLHHDETVNCARFSPDGLRLVTSTARPSSKVRVWDARSGQPLCDSIQSSAPVAGVRFAPNNRAILTSAGWGWEIHVAGTHPVPSWFPELMESIAGLRLRESDSSVRVTSGAFLRLRRQLLQSAATDPLTLWAKKFVTYEPLPQIK